MSNDPMFECLDVGDPGPQRDPNEPWVSREEAEARRETFAYCGDDHTEEEMRELQLVDTVCRLYDRIDHLEMALAAERGDTHRRSGPRKGEAWWWAEVGFRWSGYGWHRSQLLGYAISVYDIYWKVHRVRPADKVRVHVGGAACSGVLSGLVACMDALGRGDEVPAVARADQC